MKTAFALLLAFGFAAPAGSALAANSRPESQGYNAVNKGAQETSRKAREMQQQEQGRMRKPPKQMQQ